MTQPDAGAPSGTPDPNAPSGAPGSDGTVTPPPAGAPSGAAEPPAAQPELVAKEDYDKLLNQLRGNDRQRQQLQSELQAIKDKDLPEIDKLKRDAAALTEANTRLSNQLKEQAVTLAFLESNTVRWKDNAAALKLLDRGVIQISDDGTVEGVKLASEKLAKQYPWMVDDGKPDGASATPPAGGAPPMNGNSSTDKNATKGLAARLPALASRRRPVQQ